MESILVYWVTGAGTGIGRELVRQLAARGNRIYATSRTRSDLEALAAEFPGLVIPLPCDVSDESAMSSLFDTLPEVQRPQHLDGLITAAGTCEYIDLPELDTHAIRRVIEVNYFGVVHACKVALPLLQAAATAGRRPSITGICSMSVYTAFPRAEAYGSAKAAMRYFLDSLRCDLSGRVEVCIVYPGFVATPMTANNDFPMPFAISADEAAAHIVASLGKGKRSIAFPWQLHWILKLAAAMPGLWYGVVAKKLSRQQHRQSPQPHDRAA
jgi:NAD(P)-dependent dehydrogenase (short-subunit alcohol dehydrogenase family)